MTVQTWIDEFYPKPVTRTTPDEAAQHSLTKWQGLTPKNLKKHNVRTDDFGHVVGIATDDREDSLVINGSTCALCEHFLNIDDEGCEPCLLYKARGGVACDEERDDEEVAPWYAFRYHDAPSNPDPMIFWLKKAIEYQTESNAE
jgi:hypothetical protein